MGRGNGIINGRRCPKIQLCPTCGEMRVHHYAKTGSLYDCPVPKEVTEALRRFAAENGPRWKSKLCDHWQKACADISDMDERCLLQQARNMIGPRRLYKIAV